jgi:hypothetical protein
MPEGTAYEATIAPGVVLHRVLHMPTHARKRFGLRKKPLTTLFVHHSGTLSSAEAVAWAQGMARYHVIHKDWPGIGYQFGMARVAPRDAEGNLVMLRLGESDTVRAHTRLCNRFSDGLVLQGHMGRQQLSADQVECLEAFLPWWAEHNGRDLSADLGWHAQSWRWGGIPKRACPGKNAVEWLGNYREACGGRAVS